MSELQTVLLGLVSLIVGWSLSEFSQLLRGFGTRRRALNKVLADLIELRHQQLAIDHVFGELRKRWPIPPTDVAIGLRWIDTILPLDPSLLARYESTVTEIASVDPYLAFTLRSKDRGPFLIAQLRLAQSATGIDSAAYVAMEDILRTSYVGSLEEAMKDVAWKLGIVSWVRVRRFIAKERRLPEAAEKVFALGDKIVATPRASGT